MPHTQAKYTDAFCRDVLGLIMKEKTQRKNYAPEPLWRG